jgi:hypothetical protein
MRLSMIAAAALVVTVAGCGDSTPDPNDPSQQQGQNQYAGQPGQYNPNQYQQPGQYQQPAPGGTTPAPGATTPMPGATTPAPGGAAAGSPASPLAPAAAAVAQPILQGLAASEVPGMQADGSSFAGQFQEGQVLEQPINLQPGKCYTVVAGSLGAIQELDVMIQGQIAPFPAQTFVQDNQTGPTATLGGKAAGCWKYPAPIAAPAKIVLRVTKGSGMAAAKVYIK